MRKKTEKSAKKDAQKEKKAAVKAQVVNKPKQGQILEPKAEPVTEPQNGSIAQILERRILTILICGGNWSAVKGKLIAHKWSCVNHSKIANAVQYCNENYIHTNPGTVQLAFNKLHPECNFNVVEFANGIEDPSLLIPMVNKLTSM